MSRVWGRLVAAAMTVALAGTITLAHPAETRAAPSTEKAQKKQPRGSVYLFLGLGNVFSTGLNVLADKLHAKGLPANALNHNGWAMVAEQIATRYKTDKGALPVIVMGHSFGGDAALRISEALGKKGIPVALIVIFDATRAIPVSANVRHVINFYKPTGVGKKLSPGPGFRGKLENINLLDIADDVDHFNIEKNDKFHQRVIAEVARLVGRQASAGVK